MDGFVSNLFESFTARKAPEVAARCVVLYAVVAAGHKTLRSDLAKWLRREGIWESASPREVAFFQDESLSREQIFSATWRIEALFPLVWALGRFRTLGPPTALCDVPFVRSLLPPLLGSAAGFISDAALRDQSEIMDAHEETYQAHWAVRDAMLHGRPIPKGYMAEVLQERHLALNWLIFPDQEWDDVTTDT
jgi:hypothetical protein